MNLPFQFLIIAQIGLKNATNVNFQKLALFVHMYDLEIIKPRVAFSSENWAIVPNIVHTIYRLITNGYRVHLDPLIEWLSDHRMDL